MLALIDGDILLYRIGFTTENETEEWIPKHRFDDLVDSILNETQATNYQVWLSDSTENNYRRQYYPAYKANRVQPKPRHYQLLKDHAIANWGAAITPKQEADDALGIEQVKWNEDAASFLSRYNSHQIEATHKLKAVPPQTVICTIDKDLKQIPGQHYNFVKKEWDSVTEDEGRRYFYRQLLTGDATDNIQGCPKIGSARADKIIGSITTERELFECCRSGYYSAYAKHIYKTDTLDEEQKEFIDAQILMNGRMVRIRQQEGEIWHFPQ